MLVIIFSNRMLKYNDSLLKAEERSYLAYFSLRQKLVITSMCALATGLRLNTRLMPIRAVMRSK